MDRRRPSSKRPASSEEVECWSHAAASIRNLSNVYNNPDTKETIGKVNRLISVWPTDDTVPAEGFESVKTTHKKLSSALNEIRSTAEREIAAIEEAIEHLGVLIALRRAPEPSTSVEKRNKRPRASSPSAISISSSTPSNSNNNRGVTITVPLRGSVGPSHSVPFSREPKARREALAKQLPLQEGRKVAFHPPAGKPGDGSTPDGDENTWILAVVTKCINQDRNRYEVQDAEPHEAGQPGMYYNTTLRAIIPLPDPNAHPSSPSHLNAYQEFPVGSTVMALYPDTSCFYRAEVLSSPGDMQPIGRGAKYVPTYKLKFEDDDDQEHPVAAQWVVEWPGS